MWRRQFNQWAVCGSAIALGGLGGQAQALGLSGLSEKDAAAALRQALEKGAQVAVATLGQPDGFLGNAKVRIPLPSFLEDAAKALRAVGQGRQLDDLVTRMNRAAEAAVPMGQALLVGAVKSMTVQDAKGILQGPPDSVTRFFADKTRAPLTERFLPVVNKATEKVGLVEAYNRYASRATALGLLKKEESNLQRYVTERTLNGLYLVIGEEERRIRENPAAAGSALLKKVFGALR